MRCVPPAVLSGGRSGSVSGRRASMRRTHSGKYTLERQQLGFLEVQALKQLSASLALSIFLQG